MCGLILNASLTDLQMCVAMNDLEYVRRSLTLLPDELQIEAVMEAIRTTGDLSTQWRDAVQSLLDSATNQLHNDIMMIINRIGFKVFIVHVFKRFTSSKMN